VLAFFGLFIMKDTKVEAGDNLLLCTGVGNFNASYQTRADNSITF
jgi:hypothetical protein